MKIERREIQLGREVSTIDDLHDCRTELLSLGYGKKIYRDFKQKCR